MAKLRHIAYRADDVQGMASFFANAFEMTILQQRKNGAIDLSDGAVNITILPSSLPLSEGHSRVGIDHLGFTVADEDVARERVVAAGGKEINTIDLGGSANYEVKFQGPEGIVVDFGHWVGTAPIEDEAGVGQTV